MIVYYVYKDLRKNKQTNKQIIQKKKTNKQTNKLGHLFFCLWNKNWLFYDQASCMSILEIYFLYHFISNIWGSWNNWGHKVFSVKNIGVSTWNTPAPCFCEFYHVSSCCLRSVCSVSSGLISHVHLGYKTLCDRSINYLDLFNVYLHFWSAIIFIDLIVPHQISFYNSMFSILLSSLFIPL